MVAWKAKDHAIKQRSIFIDSTTFFLQATRLTHLRHLAKGILKPNLNRRNRVTLPLHRDKSPTIKPMCTAWGRAVETFES